MDLEAEFDSMRFALFRFGFKHCEIWPIRFCIDISSIFYNQTLDTIFIAT